MPPVAPVTGASIAGRHRHSDGATDVDDDTPTGRWMTYDEIAATRGIKRSGAVRLVQRQRWRRQAVRMPRRAVGRHSTAAAQLAAVRRFENQLRGIA